MKSAQIAGLNIQEAPTGTLVPNPWNPNVQSDETFEKVRLSIRQNGFIDPPMVRELDDGTFEIVDGEHKWKAAVAEGIAVIPVINLGRIPDEQAKKLTIIANELRGAPEPVLLAALIKDLNMTIPMDDLVAELPMTKVELDSLIKSTEQFDWGQVEPTLATEPTRPTDAALGLGGERRFQLGTTKGSIAASLSDQLSQEFDRSARACGTNNPEIVLGHWLARLQATSDETDEQAVKRAAAAPPPVAKKRRKVS